MRGRDPATAPARRRRATSTSRAAAAPTAWPRWPTTRAATGARRASFGPGAFDDALAMADLLRAHAPHDRAARLQHGRASRRSTRRRRRDGAIVRGGRDLPGTGGRAARASCARARSSTSAATARPPSRGSSRSTSTPPRRASGPRPALLLMHARGDEQVPYEISEELHEAAQRAQAAAAHARRPPPLAPARRGAAGGLRDASSALPAVLRIILVRLRRCPRPRDLADLPFLREALVRADPPRRHRRGARRLGGAPAARLLHARGGIGHLPGTRARRRLRGQPDARRHRGRARLRGRRAARRRRRRASTARARRCCSWPRSATGVILASDVFESGAGGGPPAVRHAARPRPRRPGDLRRGAPRVAVAAAILLGRTWSAIGFDPDGAARARPPRGPRRPPAARPRGAWRRSPPSRPSARCSSPRSTCCPPRRAGCSRRASED